VRRRRWAGACTVEKKKGTDFGLHKRMGDCSQGRGWVKKGKGRVVQEWDRPGVFNPNKGKKGFSFGVSFGKKER